MARVQFSHRGLKTEAGARARLDKFDQALRDARTLVATQDGEFYPVAVANGTFPIGLIAANGIVVVN